VVSTVVIFFRDPCFNLGTAYRKYSKESLTMDSDHIYQSQRVIKDYKKRIKINETLLFQLKSAPPCLARTQDSISAMKVLFGEQEKCETMQKTLQKLRSAYEEGKKYKETEDALK
jgi:ABC-type enterochelin transport system substrate-binding protein